MPYRKAVDKKRRVNRKSKYLWGCDLIPYHENRISFTHHHPRHRHCHSFYRCGRLLLQHHIIDDIYANSDTRNNTDPCHDPTRVNSRRDCERPVADDNSNKECGYGSSDDDANHTDNNNSDNSPNNSLDDSRDIVHLRQRRLQLRRSRGEDLFRCLHGPRCRGYPQARWR